MFHPISISLSPNTEPDDTRLAFRVLLQSWLWRRGHALEDLEREFADFLGVRHAISFNSGRSALMAILHALNLEKESEVALQAFTCNAVPNPVLWSKLRPVFVDVREQDFNMDPQDLQNKITENTKAVIAQHTFGLPADMDVLTGIARERNLFLIEDCAHALGARYKGRPVGTLGDAGFFSFSRDKVISSVYGGMAVTNDNDLARRIRAYQEKAGYPGWRWTAQQLLHPVLMNILVLPFYAIFGKYLLVLFQNIHVLSKAVHWKEKRGGRPSYFPKRMPNALALLALRQMQKAERFNAHRKEIARTYMEALKGTPYVLPAEFPDREHIYLRFPVRHPKAHEIIRKAWKRNMLLGDWYTTPISPHDTRMEACGYMAGAAPVAEKLSKETLNLPTHIRISEKDAERIISFLIAVEA